MPTCQVGYLETEFDTLRDCLSSARGEGSSIEEGVRVVEDKEEWTALSSALGEALLDVERTFLDFVERQSSTVNASPLAPYGSPVKAYFDAWSRLDEAHRVLERFLMSQGLARRFTELRCEQCSQELDNSRLYRFTSRGATGF